VREERLVRGQTFGTEDIYKIYAESFLDSAHLARILSDAQAIVDASLAH